MCLLIWSLVLSNYLLMSLWGISVSFPPLVPPCSLHQSESYYFQPRRHLKPLFCDVNIKRSWQQRAVFTVHDSRTATAADGFKPCRPKTTVTDKPESLYLRRVRKKFPSAVPPSMHKMVSVPAQSNSLQLTSRHFRPQVKCTHNNWID